MNPFYIAIILLSGSALGVEIQAVLRSVQSGRTLLVHLPALGAAILLGFSLGATEKWKLALAIAATFMFLGGLLIHHRWQKSPHA